MNSLNILNFILKQACFILLKNLPTMINLYNQITLYN